MHQPTTDLDDSARTLGHMMESRSVVIHDLMAEIQRNRNRYVDSLVVHEQLTAAQVPLLLFLHTAVPGTNQNRIAHLLGLDKATISRHAAILTRLGLAKKSALSRPRSICLTLTDKGAALAQEVDKGVQRWGEEMAQGMGEVEQLRLLGILRLAARNSARILKVHGL